MRRPTSLRPLLLTAALGLTLGVPSGALAQSGASAEEVAQLKSQIVALQAQVNELAAKVAALQAAPGGAALLADGVGVAAEASVEGVRFVGASAPAAAHARVISQSRSGLMPR